MNITSSPVPPSALIDHVAILGKTGSGKTFAAKGLVEALLDQKRRVCVIDPTGVWWGLRSSADGKSAGFEILVLGGDHGDLPLPPLGGAAVARLVAEQGANCIIDTSLMTIGERSRWFIDFADGLYRLNRAPLHLVIDEVHNFAPQGKVPDPETGKMVHAANQLFSGGRSRGLRIIGISQRPAKWHKDALTSVGTLIPMRMLAPQDRAAVKDWVDGMGDPVKGREVLDSLAGLRKGEGWVWFPEGGLLAKVRFPHIKTFDSSATPLDGQALLPKRMAEVNLDEIKAAMGEAVAIAEANDPKRLRDRIRQLEARPAATDDKQVAALKQEVESLRAWSQKQSDAATRWYGRHSRMLERVRELHIALTKIVDEPLEANPVGDEATKHPVRAVVEPPPRVSPPRSPAPSREEPAAGGERAGGSKAERLVLATLRSGPISKLQLAIATCYAHTGGGFCNALSALRTAGLIDGSSTIHLTAAGRQAAAHLVPFSPDQVWSQWINRSAKAERSILDVLRQSDGESKAALAKATGYEAEGGGFNNALSALRSLGLVVTLAGVNRLSDEFRLVLNRGVA